MIQFIESPPIIEHVQRCAMFPANVAWWLDLTTDCYEEGPTLPWEKSPIGIGRADSANHLRFRKPRVAVLRDVNQPRPRIGLVTISPSGRSIALTHNLYRSAACKSLLLEQYSSAPFRRQLDRPNSRPSLARASLELLPIVPVKAGHSCKFRARNDFSQSKPWTCFKTAVLP